MRPTDDPAEGDLASTTLAEIYVQQGLYERAVAIYQRLATRAPDGVIWCITGSGIRAVAQPSLEAPSDPLPTPAARREALRSRLESVGATAMLITGLPHMRYLSGFSGSS
jgi:hypothetical protein